MKSKVKELIEKSGIYVSTSTRTSIDNDVRMGPTFGIGYGTAGSKRNGWKYPFSFSGYRGDLETNDRASGSASSRREQIMSGVGYQWVHGKMVYGAQLGLGYSFNKVTLDPASPTAFGVPEPVGVDGQQFIRGAAASEGRVLRASRSSACARSSATPTPIPMS